MTYLRVFFFQLNSNTALADDYMNQNKLMKSYNIWLNKILYHNLDKIMKKALSFVNGNIMSQGLLDVSVPIKEERGMLGIAAVSKHPG